ncbi:unnamed protein product [Prorocentrum cordatum]|uniref:Fatty acid hydroxylase domain-containing protein n=1 Tax=Prorocentrum cordatum TaxID=2364126 RepID=A0ABN9YDE5_9DINO|nr:unnamed protein product [Polarella glacialis]
MLEPIPARGALLPHLHGPSAAEPPCERPGQQGRHGFERSCIGRRFAARLGYAVFALLLIYGSGFPLLLSTVLQQVGHLPEGPWFFRVLYPIGYSRFERGEDSTVDLVTQPYLMLAIPWFVASMVWEAFMICVVVPPTWRPKHVYRINDTMSSLSTGVLYMLAAQVILFQWAKPLYTSIYSHFRVTDAFLDLHSVMGWWLCLLMNDILYYVYHRASHTISWLWAGHVVHHSSEEYNLSTALRQPAIDFLTPSLLLSSTGMAFFFPPEMATLHGEFSLLYQFWIHTQLVPPLPTIELVFNTASLHRIHHARNAHLLGKNYGSIFSLWDRVGGTFESEPSEGEEIYYGIVPPLNSWSPLWANIVHWHHMLMVQRRWHGWKTLFVHWTPPNGSCPRLGMRLNPRTKYDKAPATAPLSAYVALEFSLGCAGAVLLIMLGPPVGLVAAATGLPEDFSAGLCHVAAFLAVLASLTSVAALESAEPGRSLCRALIGNATVHVSIAVACLALLCAGATRAMSTAVGGVVFSYAVLHLGVPAVLCLKERRRVASAARQ